MLNPILNSNLSLETIYFWLVGLLLAITFHEAAHAWVADKLGDKTPRYMGRVNLNPLAHLDPVGTLLILFAGFGWGKPVQFNPLSLRNPALGAALISLAGPLTNFILAGVFAILIRLEIAPLNLWAQIAAINIMLGVFNLVPFAPLDGEKVVGGLLPPSLRAGWSSIQAYGIFYLIAFIFLAGPLLGRVINIIFTILTGQSFR
ncbi:MAG TPA: site-2 protease family protein [Patescibacteria group bacterium]|nr:site-2 protease family protein [Patescibacteria group bacterium]